MVIDIWPEEADFVVEMLIVSSAVLPGASVTSDDDAQAYWRLLKVALTESEPAETVCGTVMSS